MVTIEMEFNNKKIVENILLKKIKINLKNLDISLDEFDYDVDLLNSGILDSLELVEILFEIEKKTKLSPNYFLEKISGIEVTVNWFLSNVK